MKLLVLLNEAVSTLDGGRPEDVRKRVADCFASVNGDAEVRVIDPRWLDKHVQEASDGYFDAVVAGGGDNMLNAVANAVAASGRKPFGVLPLGRQNHFAEELGFSTDLHEAVRMLADAKIVDTLAGELNGRLFLSYAAVGLDPLVVMRPQLNGHASPLTAEQIVNPASAKHDVRLSTRGRTVTPSTPCIIVSNNTSQMRAFGLKAAPPPDRGMINAYVARRGHTRGPLRRILKRLHLLPSPPASHFQAMVLPEMRVDSRRSRKVVVCIDGEMLEMRPPLHFRLRSTPLRLLVPQPLDLSPTS